METAIADHLGYFSREDCRVSDLAELIAAATRQTRLADYPHAEELVQGVLRYRADRLRAVPDRGALSTELARALDTGPGIVVIEAAFTEPVVDAASEAFNELIGEQRRGGREVGDHFARPGANDRVWNALEKFALTRPEVFVSYYANETLALLAEAWLGPRYQLTSQVNVVNPGGAGQQVHRDYHLGFLTAEEAARFPRQVHHLAPRLTLQAAVAHVDMPVVSGPTLYLPHSHKYAPGYLAWSLPEFAEYFAHQHVQMPLHKGDAVFFNPALFHAAGANHSGDIHRMANLLQISSAFGRAMERPDRRRLVLAVYPEIQAALDSGRLDQAGADRVIAATAEGYPFPTDLDQDPPVDGLAPAAQADLVHRSLARRDAVEVLAEVLAAHHDRSHGVPPTTG